MHSTEYPSNTKTGGPGCWRGTKKGLNFVLQQFHLLLNRSFFNLGKIVAEYKGYFIIVPLFLTLLAFTGFQRVNYVDDPEYLFAPSTGPARGDRAVIEENFSLNFTALFDPTRITRTGRFARFIITAKDNGTIFRTSFWNDLLLLDRIIKNITVIDDDSRTYSYEELCAIKDHKCLKNDVLELSPRIPEIQNGTFEIHYPINWEPFTLPHFFGGIETDKNADIILSAKATTLYYWIRTNDDAEELRGQKWEKIVLETLSETEFENILVARFTSRTLEDELENNTNSVKPFVSVTLFIMTSFSVLVCLMGDWVRAKPIMGLIGVMTSVLSTITAFGLLIYLDVPFIGINMAAPFLMLGIGIDDTFVLLAAWRRTRIQDSVPQRLAETYSEAAVSITITSLTDMVSFFIGVITPFPSVQIFCTYTGTAVFITYIWHITLFGGCLALAGHAEKGQRHSLFCGKVKPKSVSQIEKNCCYTAFCSGGITPADPWNDKDNQPHMMMVFFRDYVGRMLNIPAVKVFVILVFLVYLGGAIYGCLRVKEGLEKKRLSRFDSYSVDFYHMEDKYFRVFPYSIQVVMTGDIVYSDDQTREDILNLMKTFENESYVYGDYTQSVIRSWYKFLEENDDYLDFNITDEKSFISYLREVYVSDPDDVLNLDLRYNDDYTRIIASRFIIQTYELPDSNADKNMMVGLRRIADESKFNVTVFNPFFVFFDQFLLVRTLTIQAVSLAAIVMMFVSLVFIPNPWCSMWVAFSIISIEVGVVGFMTMWDVNLDSISMINLIMCIGFSVDFSAHISYAYLTAKGETPDEKVRECLFALGLPILQGGVSTILGVVALVLAPSYIFVTFFKIVFLVIFFGIMHGIFLLPVLLSLMGPGSFGGSEKKKSPSSKLYDPNMFVQKGGDIQRFSKEDPSRQIESSPESSLQSGSFAPEEVVVTSDPTRRSHHRPTCRRYPEMTPEKDMGIGTSGEDSSECSLQDPDEMARGPSVVEVRGGGRNKSSLPIKEVYSNKAFISDGEEESSAAPLEEEQRRGERHRLARRNSNYIPSNSHQAQPQSLHRQYSEHYRPEGRRKKKHHSRER